MRFRVVSVAIASSGLVVVSGHRNRPPERGHGGTSGIHDIRPGHGANEVSNDAFSTAASLTPALLICSAASFVAVAS